MPLVDSPRPARDTTGGEHEAPVFFQPTSPWLTMDEAASCLGGVSAGGVARWLDRLGPHPAHLVCGQGARRMVRVGHLAALLAVEGKVGNLLPARPLKALETWE